MNILLPQSLPFSIDGIGIYPSFRNMIQLELLWQEENIDLELKPALALNLLYKEKPVDISKAVEGLFWFYSCGQVFPSRQDKKVKNKEPIYSFLQDGPMIYAAFYQAYGINLSQVDFLHWWEFSALFYALPESTPFVNIMKIRAMDLDGLDAKQKEYYQKLKNQYKLPKIKSAKEEKDSEKEMKDWVNNRFALAERMGTHGI